jgi:ferritin-like metal-binding protein YciE
LRELLIEELRDLYSAETQLVDALPKMAEAAASRELKSLLKITWRKGHVERPEDVFGLLEGKPSGETCDAMKGLVKEGENLVHARRSLREHRFSLQRVVGEEMNRYLRT